MVKEGPFEFWFYHREAIETLVYVYEVMKKRNFISLSGMARNFGAGPIQRYDPSYDRYPMYAFKMVTNITEGKWLFIRIDQEDFEKYRFNSIKELISAIGD